MGLFDKITKLFDADIKKVDFLPEGAQPDAKILLFKGIEGEPKEDALLLADALTCLESFGCTLHSILQDTSTDRAELLKGALDQFTILIDSAIPQWIDGKTVSLEKDAITEEQFEVLKGMHSQLSKVVGAKTCSCKGKCEKCMAEGEGEESGTMDQMLNEAVKIEEADQTNIKKEELPMAEINKSALPEDAQNYIQELESQIAKSAETSTKTEEVVKGLEASIAKMKDDQLVAEYIAKAKSFTNLGIKAEEFGPVLKAVATLGEEIYAKVEAVLKAANETAGTTDIFKEVGSSAATPAGTGDAWSRIEALASQIVTKDSSVTKEQAITKVLATTEGAELYQEYVDGQ